VHGPQTNVGMIKSGEKYNFVHLALFFTLIFLFYFLYLATKAVSLAWTVGVLNIGD